MSQTSKDSNTLHTLQTCVVNTFSSDVEYLNNCCSGLNEPFINEFIKKRCNDLYTIDESKKDLTTSNSNEIAVFYR